MHITDVTDMLPPVGAAREPRHQVYITDDQKPATVTLRGKFAEPFDADTLCNWSKNEHIVVLFVGVMMDQYSVSLQVLPIMLDVGTNN